MTTGAMAARLNHPVVSDDLVRRSLPVRVVLAFWAASTASSPGARVQLVRAGALPHTPYLHIVHTAQVGTRNLPGITLRRLPTVIRKLPPPPPNRATHDAVLPARPPAILYGAAPPRPGGRHPGLLTIAPNSETRIDAGGGPIASTSPWRRSRPKRQNAGPATPSSHSSSIVVATIGIFPSWLWNCSSLSHPR